MTTTAEDTREKLIAAASRTIHELGLAATTLAIVSKRARVPLGNVYYHFRTKETLAAAVLEAHHEQLRERLLECEKKPRPIERIVAFIGTLDARDLARHGCPHGSLATELEKGDAPLGGQAGKLLEMQLDWLGRQLGAAGLGRRAPATALELLCALQGASVVGNALGDAALIKTRLRDITKWVRGLV